jgi:DegV family protein with EDD domain
VKTGYVIDSTIDLPEEILKKYSVRVVPLKVIWGSSEYLDKKTITADEFFANLEKTDLLPRSSSPSAGEFLRVYKEMMERGYDNVISLHLSSKLSGTCQAAKVAASMSGGKVRVFDSRSISLGTGFILLEIIKIVQRNGSMKEIEDLLGEKNPAPDIYFVVEDLNYLYKGGRIGKAKKILGTLLDIKPLLRMQNGEITVADKIIGGKKVTAHMEKILKNWKDNKKDIKYVGIIYSNSKEKIQPIISLCKKYFPSIEPMITQASPVVGCHIGQGLIAVGAY